MEITKVYELPTTDNVCNQTLREVYRHKDKWSIAHVTMGPRAESLYHRHQKMDEVYVITKGCGDLVIGKYVHRVMTGNVVWISAGLPHMLRNVGLVEELEHLVLACPAFDPLDVIMAEIPKQLPPPRVLELPPFTQAFDGAQIFSLSPPTETRLSFAFGFPSHWSEENRPHYHKQTTEWMYVVNGSGYLEKNDDLVMVDAGDWIKIKPLERHQISLHGSSNLVVMCLCDPKFSMDDVFFD